MTPEKLVNLVTAIFVAHNTAPDTALTVAKSLVQAEIDGQGGHGLSRVEAYAKQAASGKVNGHARPVLSEVAQAAARVDAGHGFAFPALHMATDWLIERTSSTGIATVGIYRSHHFGAAGHVVERLANAGLVGLVCGNAPKAIAIWGGAGPFFGTNPLAFAAPRLGNGSPLVIDMSLSKTARGKIMQAARKGEAIPEGLAVDEEGRPTTDAEAALKGAMLPMGDAKGSALVLMVEILATALVGANFSHEASSFFDADGEPPGVGQFIIAIDPGPLSGGGFEARFESLIEAMLAQEGVRLPGSRREKAREASKAQGLNVSGATVSALEALLQSRM